MSDEYQLRKDIDKLFRDVYNLESGALQLTTLEEFNELSELVKDTSSLTNLETSLDNFSNDLDNYNDELESFSGQLSQYGDELGGFTGQLQGFTTAIDNLKNWMYGYNPLDPSITYENPSSDSIKGMIGVLQGLLEEIEAGDGIVLENLGRLKDHLQAFTGTLAEFKQYLTNQGVDVSTLDDSVLSLILEINKNIAVIDEHEQTIGEVDLIIGNPATATTPATGFYKKFDDGDAIMEDLDGRASQLEDTVGDENSGLVKDTNDLIDSVGDENSGLIKDTNDIIDTIGEPATTGQSATGMHLLIDNAQSTATAVDGVATLIKEKIGYESIETPLQSQITAQNGKIGNVPSGTSLQGQIGNVYEQIGDVDMDWQGDLQTQINDVISTLLSMMPVVHTVNTLSDVSTMDWGRRGYIAPFGYPYKYIYCKDTGKYYEYIEVDDGGG